MVNNSV